MESVLLEAGIDDAEIKNFICNLNQQLDPEDIRVIFDQGIDSECLPWEIKASILENLSNDLIDALDNAGFDKSPSIHIALNDSIIFDKVAVNFLIALIRIKMSPDWIIQLEWQEDVDSKPQRLQVNYLDPHENSEVECQNLDALRIPHTVH